MTVWECQLRDMDSITDQLIDFIESRRIAVNTQSNSAYGGSLNG